MESPLLVTWLQGCAALATWLWVAPGAGALPTFMPIDLPTPRVGAVWGAAIAGIGVVNHDGIRDPGAPFRRASGIAVTTVDPNGDPVPDRPGPLGHRFTGDR